MEYLVLLFCQIEISAFIVLLEERLVLARTNNKYMTFHEKRKKYRENGKLSSLSLSVLKKKLISKIILINLNIYILIIKTPIKYIRNQ